MEWCVEIQQPHGENTEASSNMNFSLRRVDSIPESGYPNIQNDIILQWIICPFVIERGVVYDIPTGETEWNAYIATNIFPLFNQVREVYIEKKLFGFRFSEIKEKVRNNFNEIMNEPSFIYSLIKDFYLKSSLLMNNSAIEIKLYKIDKRIFRTRSNYIANTFEDDLWRFLERTHKIDKRYPFTLFPRNWMFNDDLLNSEFLQYIVSFAEEIVLTVNSYDQSLQAITIN